MKYEPRGCKIARIYGLKSPWMKYPATEYNNCGKYPPFISATRVLTEEDMKPTPGAKRLLDKSDFNDDNQADGFKDA